MPIATDAQMQKFADERLRTFAELMRKVFVLAAEHQAAIDDVYARATQNPGTRWNDNRSDGPPHLLQSGFDGSNAASPDDMLEFNTLIAKLLQLRDGTFANVGEANGFAANWSVVQDACVRSIIG